MMIEGFVHALSLCSESKEIL